jgi:preprotein translocase subunit SecA
VFNYAVQEYERKEQEVGEDLLRYMERMVFLQIIDSKWKDHLYAMDKLREGIGLRAYGHRDPLIEYKNEAFHAFAEMMAGIEEQALEMVFKLQPARPERLKTVFNSRAGHMVHQKVSSFENARSQAASSSPSAHNPQVSTSVPSQGGRPAGHPKVGRNDPCPCGSGKKFKKCCGRNV